jgi:hypothetical protein
MYPLELIFYDVPVGREIPFSPIFTMHKKNKWHTSFQFSVVNDIHFQSNSKLQCCLAITDSCESYLVLKLSWWFADTYVLISMHYLHKMLKKTRNGVISVAPSQQLLISFTKILHEFQWNLLLRIYHAECCQAFRSITACSNPITTWSLHKSHVKLSIFSKVAQ